MLAERRRALRLLTERGLARLWIYRFTARLGAWLLVFGVLTIDTGSIGLPALILAARFLPPPVISWLWGRFGGSAPFRWLTSSAIAAALVIVVVARLLEPMAAGVSLIAVGAVLGLIAAVDGEAIPILLARMDRTKFGPSARLGVLVDQFALLVAGLLGALVLQPGRPLVVLIVGGVALLIAALASPGWSKVVAAPDSVRGATGITGSSAATRSFLVYAAAAFGSGALALSLLASFFVPGAPMTPFAAAGVALAFLGVGMLVGPLPVPRMLLRVSAPVITLVLAGVISAAAVIAVLGGDLLIAVPAFVVLGVAAVTQDSLRAIALRRLAPDGAYVRVTRASAIALGVGQVAGALAMALGASTVGPAGVVVLVAVGQLVVVVGALVVGSVRDSLTVGGLSSLPVKSVEHQLSWETNPDPMVPDFTTAQPRARRLAKWITRRADPQRLKVTLPISRREYEIYRPDDDSRERLFDEGRADPEKQMPYWAKVWPSGVALADVVVERQAEVAGRNVLELGAGLGVTACTVLEADGSIVTADYSALPLAHCRLNTLVNSGRAPRSICFNWRHDPEVEAATSRPELANGFPLILAADVLYEGRDAEPLLNVVERLLQPDGSLWLAEPVRRTAQRFLDSAAAVGWEITSRQVQADWPDATSGPVNLHFLTRSPYPDRVVADLGGWRI